MRNPLRFFPELLSQPPWIPAWVGFMMAVNMVSLAFWEEALAQGIFVVFLLSSMIMMGLYARFGYERILGLGHVLWIPLLAWVVLALPEATGAFRAYLVTWGLTTAISLGLDVADVWRYLVRGPRAAESP